MKYIKINFRASFHTSTKIRQVTLVKQAGFTLIELLVVIAIIALLASVVLVSLRSAKDKAYDAQIKSDMSQVRTALELYAAANEYLYPLIIVSAPQSINVARNKNNDKNEESQGTLSSLVHSSVDVLKKSFTTIAYAQSRDIGCIYFDNLGASLVPNFIGKMPRHPVDNGTSACYRYFALEDRTAASVYSPLVTDTYSNGVNKQIGIVLGKTDVDSLKNICEGSRTLNARPFPMFATITDNICEGDSVADTVIGVTNGSGDLSSDSYI